MAIESLRDISLQTSDLPLDDVQTLLSLPNLVCFDIFNTTVPDTQMWDLLKDFSHPNLEKLILSSGLLIYSLNYYYYLN